MSDEWRDGFLFLGNELSLDFLNTRPLLDPSAGPLEMLPDATSVLRWMTAAQLIPPQAGQKLARAWSSNPINDLLQFRERLRKAVSQMEAGQAPSKAFLENVNQLLEAHPTIDQIRREGSACKRSQWFNPQTLADLFAPLLDNVATLLTLPDKSRLRKCGACILHFHDTSKKGTRYWCSMNLCGNRSKVAAYAKRQRGQLA